MKVSNITNKYYSIKNSSTSNIHSNDICFRGIVPKKLTLKDIFTRKENSNFAALANIRKGRFGTECDSSHPLPLFFKLFKTPEEKTDIINSGMSTNKCGQAYSFLKAKSNIPLSTSFVHDCSVMYLYNEKESTHLLYHIYRDEKEEEISQLIKLFMPNGYNKAAIVLGYNKYHKIHAQYIPSVYKAIKDFSKNAIIKIYHNSSTKPEIVGYKGEMYEIPNLNYSQKYNIADKGQATFKIHDHVVFSTLYGIPNKNTVEELMKVKKELKNDIRYNKEVREILERAIETRAKELQKIESIKTPEEFKEFMKDKNIEYIYGYPQIGKAGFYTVLNNKKRALGMGLMQ